MKINGINIISIKELDTNSREGVLLVDVRDREKYIEGHIPGAIYKTEEQIYKTYKIFSNYDKVYIYCDYGNKGLRIVKYLMEKYNIDNVYNIIGGYNVYRGKIEKFI